MDQSQAEDESEQFYAIDLNKRGCIVGLLHSRDHKRSWPMLLEPIPQRWRRPPAR